MNPKTAYLIENPEILEEILSGMDEEAAKLLSEIVGLRVALTELREASAIIADVARYSWSTRKGALCPHGNGGFYPSSAHWCDDCFERLNLAIFDAKDILKETE